MTAAIYPTAKSPPARAVRPGVVTAVVCLALDAYSLVFASLLLPAGAIGDRFGRRWVLIAGLSIFGAASAVAMTANSAGELIGLRAVMGLGAALVMPATLSTITGTFASEQRTRAVSIWAAVAGGAAVLGLLVSGAVLQVWSWPSVFALNVILAAAAIAGTIRFVPESADPDTPRLDISGAILAVIGLVALVYSIIEAPSEGWLSARTLAGLAAGLVVLVGFVGWELRRRAPMIDPRVFARPALAAGSLSIFVQFFALFGFIFIVLQYLQLIRGDSGLVSAVSMLPMAAAMLPTSRLAPALVDRLGARAVCTTGLALIAAALVILAQLTGTSGYWLLAVGLIPLGIGMGLAMTPATSNITSALPASQQGVASALNDLSREVGGAVGIAVLASILTAAYQSNLHLAHIPAAQAGSARSSVAVATRLGPAVAAQAHSAFTDGMHLALYIAAGIVLAAAITVGTLLRGRGRRNVMTGVHQRSISSAAAGMRAGSPRSSSCAAGCSSSAMHTPGRPLRSVSLPATANSQNMFSNSAGETWPPSPPSSAWASRIDITSSPGRRRFSCARR
ncbi:MAG TPA: MFS transporter [Streptosporangiaceae bacterium]|jgi:EmrB/QacA subfamily drug resistance transporter|nr:MFS transporter [Streptosporangiaceae bacterium]HEX2823756.1 MFS transporter [Streptosporangiaceae bacterium]